MSNNLQDDERSVELFKTYLRFRTVSGEGPRTGSYEKCVEWLAKIAKEEIPCCETEIVEPVAKKPVLVVKIFGEQPELDSVVLNSHYDVVPAMEEHWDVDPWAAVEKDGKIFGRGTQDMKSVSIQYVLALGRLYRKKQKMSSGVTHMFKRNVFLTFVPDEEIGGKDGMHAFIEQGHFDRLFGKVGVALDEGLANPEKGKCTVFYGERCPLWIYVYSNGPTGHGSRFISNTAIEKLMGVANKAFEKRREQEKLLGYGGQNKMEEKEGGCKHCEAKKLGDVLTINLTVLKAGVSADGGETYALNVIPTEAMAGFDIRVPVTMPLKEVRAMLDDWTKEEGMSWKCATGDYYEIDHPVSSIDPEKCAFWKSFNDTCKTMNLTLVPEIFPAGTDSRFIRYKGINAFGFSPMPGSPILLHEHNEYLERSVFLDGIVKYESILPALADLQSN